jgi:transposase
MRSKKNEPQDHALGRSQGGYGTKLHLIVEGHGIPLGFKLTPGQAHESKSLQNLLQSIRVPHVHAGRPTVRPEKLAGDKAYSSNEIRRQLQRRHIIPVIPMKKNERRRRAFDKETYRQRNVVERCIGWMKENRRIGTRYDKLAITFSAMVQLGIIQQYLRKIELINTT